MKRILFVDDEPNILTGLRRMLRGMRNEWDMAFVDSAKGALTLMADKPFDAVISDVRMPGMDGIALLKDVQKDYPGTVRIILSGHSDYNAAIASTRVAHQYLSKPCEADRLRHAVERNFALEKLLSNKTLQTIAATQGNLPSPTGLYMEILQDIESPDSDLHHIGELIAKDISMTAKILQLVNSAFFGLPRSIADVREAVTLLGLDTIRGLILYSKVVSVYHGAGEVLDLEALHRHSNRVGVLAKAITRHHGGDNEHQGQAQIAGMLHDIGHLIMATAMPGHAQAVRLRSKEEGTPIWRLEQDLLGCTHAELGAYLLGLWGLPNLLVEPVAHHHQPERHQGAEFDLVTAVHVANALAHVEHSERAVDIESLLDMDYISHLGLQSQFADWHRLAEECSGN